MGVRSTFALVAGLAAFAACGCGGGGDEDASTAGGTAGAGGAAGAAGAAGAGAGETFASPAPPALPVLTPCPAGWTQSALTPQVAVCRPVITVDGVDATCPAGWTKEKALVGSAWERPVCRAPTLPASCPDGEMASLATATCVPVGSACPTGEWPAGLPASAVVYVKPGATGTAGTLADPVGTIAEALALAASGATIALSKGTHAGITVDRKVTIVGACAKETAIAASSGLAVVRTSTGGDLTLRDVRVEGDAIGVHADKGPVALDGVWIHKALRYGLYVTGPAVDVEDSLIHETRLAATGKDGWGVWLAAGAKGAFRRTAIEASHTVALRVGEKGTSAKLEDVVVRGTQQAADFTFGRGIQVTQGATLEGARVLAENNRETGIYVSGAGTQATLTDVTVRGTETDQSSGDFGVGMYVRDNAIAVVTRGTFDDNRAQGVLVSAAATATLSDLVVRRTRTEEVGGALGEGIRSQAGSTVHVTRAIFEENHAVGAIAFDAGAKLFLDHVVVAKTQTGFEGVGQGIAADLGGRVEARHAVVTACNSEGAYASRKGSVLILEDALMDGTFSAGFEAVGIGASQGASVEARRVWVDGSEQVGATASDAGSSLLVEDAVISRGKGAKDGKWGAGVLGQAGASVTARRVLIEDNRLYGASALEGSLHVEDVVVSVTRSETASHAFGNGLVAAYGARLDGARVLVRKCQGGGVLLTDGADAELSDLTIEDIAADELGFFGFGFEAGAQSKAKLSRVRTDRTRVAGVIATESAALAVEDLAVLHVSPSIDSGEQGMGMGAFLGASLTVKNAVIDDVRMAGAWAHLGTLVLDRVDIRHVAPGTTILVDASGKPVGDYIEGFGDGVLLTSSTVTANRVSAGACARAGFLSSASSGSFAGIVATANDFGFVLQGNPRPTVDDASRFSSNRQKDRLDDAGLSVPNRPPQKPSAPPK